MNLDKWIDNFCSETKTKIQENYDLTDELLIVDRRKKSANKNRVNFIIEYLDRELSISLIEQFRFGKEDKELQILINLKEFKSDKGFGFTNSRNEAIKLAINWLSYKQSYQEIYQQFHFLGGSKRHTKDLKSRISEETLKYKDQLEKESFKLEKDDRSVLLTTTNFYGSNKILVFYYREIKVFEYEPDDVKLLIVILEAWLEHKWSPERIQENFKGIERVRHKELFMKWKWINRRKIRFIKSWDGAESHYEDQVVRTFIDELRSNNYDHKTRAGNVLGRLVISRSKEYGLRTDQKSMSFDFNETGPNLTINMVDGRRLNFEEIQYNDVIQKECQRLLKEPIN